LDAIDKGILIELTNNCRVTYRELAKKFSISYNAIKKRIKKIEKLGIIYQYQVRLSLSMTGANLLFGLLFTDGSQDEEDFVNHIGKLPKSSLQPPILVDIMPLLLNIETRKNF
jgi:DNA-binding Lrp family transcriptional regulator